MTNVGVVSNYAGFSLREMDTDFIILEQIKNEDYDSFLIRSFNYCRTHGLSLARPTDFRCHYPDRMDQWSKVELTIDDPDHNTCKSVVLYVSDLDLDFHFGIIFSPLYKRKYNVYRHEGIFDTYENSATFQTEEEAHDALFNLIRHTRLRIILEEDT